MVNNPPASAVDTSSIPSPGRSHLPWSNFLQQGKLPQWETCTPLPATTESPHKSKEGPAGPKTERKKKGKNQKVPWIRVTRDITEKATMPSEHKSSLHWENNSRKISEQSVSNLFSALQQTPWCYSQARQILRKTAKQYACNASWES